MGKAQYVLYLLETCLGTVAIYYRQKSHESPSGCTSAEPPSANRHTLNVCQDIYLAPFPEKVRETPSWQTITFPQTERVSLAIAPSGRTTFNSLRSPGGNSITFPVSPACPSVPRRFNRQTAGNAQEDETLRYWSFLSFRQRRRTG
jgi:hypothetical protein